MAKSAYPSALGSLALAAALAGCHGQTSAPAAAPVPVSVEKVVRQDVPVMADYVAHTEAVQQVDLVPRVDGYLQTVNFRDGSFVHQGQLLMQIQPEQYQAAVLAAQASLDKGNANLVRAESNVADQTAKAQVAADAAVYFRAVKQLQIIKPLAQKEAVPQTDLYNAQAQFATSAASLYGAKAQLQDVELNQRTAILNAKSDIDQATAQLINAKLNLSYTTITSPVTGIISFLKVDQGNYVSQAKTPTLATVSTVNPMKVVFQLSESDYLKVAPRLLQMRDQARRPTLTLFLSDGSQYPYPGTPSSINRAVDQQTGTIAVESLFPNPDGLLRPGQFARVDFPISIARNALLVPQTAVKSLQGSSVVYEVGPDNKIQIRSVELGTSYGPNVVVESGIQAGDVVVVGGLNRLQPDSVVVPAPARTPGK
jgi:membrane fusion protein (multidrug efflux system)